MALPTRDPNTSLGSFKDIQLRLGPLMTRGEQQLDDFLVYLGDEYLATVHVQRHYLVEQGSCQIEVVERSELLLEQWEADQGGDHHDFDSLFTSLLWDRWQYHHREVDNHGYWAVFWHEDGTIGGDAVDGCTLQDGIDFTRMVFADNERKNPVIKAALMKEGNFSSAIDEVKNIDDPKFPWSEMLTPWFPMVRQ